MITVDTVVAHLDRALSVPTLVLLPFASDGRWFMARSDSPWLGSVRLVRQDPDLSWERVVNLALSA